MADRTRLPRHWRPAPAGTTSRRLMAAALFLAATGAVDAQAAMVMQKGQWLVNHTIVVPEMSDPIDGGSDSLCLADDTEITIEDVEADMEAETLDLIEMIGGDPVSEIRMTYGETLDSDDRVRVSGKVAPEVAQSLDITSAEASFEQTRAASDRFEILQHTKVSRGDYTRERTQRFIMIRKGDCSPE